MSIRLESFYVGEYHEEEHDRQTTLSFHDFRDEDNPIMFVASAAISRLEGKLAVFECPVVDIVNASAKDLDKQSGLLIPAPILPHVTQEEYLVALMNEGERPAEFGVVNAKGHPISLKLSLVPA